MRTTVILILASFFMLALIWVFDFNEPSTPTIGEGKLCTLNIDSVSRILIRRGEELIDISRIGSGWQLAEPQNARVQYSAVNKLLNTFENLCAFENVSEKERTHRELTLQDYGLDKPETELLIESGQGEFVIHIGNKSIIGNSVYLRLPPHATVVSVPADFLDALPKTRNDSFIRS